MSAYYYFATDAEKNWTDEKRGASAELSGYCVIASCIGVDHIAAGAKYARIGACTA